MYKHVAQYTQPLRDFSYEGVNIGRVVKQQEERITKKLKRKTEDYASCTLCENDFQKNPTSVRNHLNSIGHQKRLRKFNQRYIDFIKGIRKSVLKQKRPKNKYFRRLRYYTLIENFDCKID